MCRLNATQCRSASHLAVFTIGAISVLILGLGLFIYAFCAALRAPGFDESNMFLMARDWVNSGFFPPIGRYPIGFRLILGPLYLFGVPAWPTLRISQILCTLFIGLAIMRASSQSIRLLQPAWLGVAAILLTLGLDSGYHHLEIWVALFGAIGLGQLMTGGSFRNYFFAGLAFGIAFHFKQFGLYYLIAAIIALMYQVISQRQIRPNAVRAMLLLLGFTIPMAVVLVYYSLFGLANEFFFYMFLEPVTQYTGDDSPVDWAQAVRLIPLIVLTLGGVLLSRYEIWTRDRQIMLLATVVLSLASLHKYLIGHYAIPAVPAAVFLGGPPIFALIRKWQNSSWGVKYAIVGGMALVLISVVALAGMRTSLIRGIVTGSHKRQMMELAEDVAAYTNKGDIVYLDASTPTHGSKIYAVTDTVPAGLISTFRYGDRKYYSLDHGARLLEQLKTGKITLIVFDRIEARKGWTRVFYGNALDEIVAIVENEYEPIPFAKGKWKVTPLIRKDRKEPVNCVSVNYWLCTVIREPCRKP